MIPSRFSLVLLDHQDPKLLSGQLYLPLNFVPLRSPALGEAHSCTRTLQLVALVVLVPCEHLEHMGKWTLPGIRAPPFFGQVGLSHSVGSSLMPALYLSEFLLVPSFLPSVLMTLDFPSLTVRSGHRFLPSFSLFVDECGIDDESLVLESLWFWYSFENFSMNYFIIKKQKAKRGRLSWLPNRLAELWVNILFLPPSLIIIYFTTYHPFHWLAWKWMYG